MSESEHLCDQGNREDVAVELLLGLLPATCPEWYESIGIDPDHHWALVRPVFNTPMLRHPQAEVDVVFGRMVAVSTGGKTTKIIWPPSTDFMVAVEAKCPLVKWEDGEAWASAASPKSNLRDQLKRDIALGFSRVAAIHVVAMPPSNGFWDAMLAADAFGSQCLPFAERSICDLTGDLPVGHAVFSIAGLMSKHERMSGVMLPKRIVPAPVAGLGALQTIRDQVDSRLRGCAEPTTARAIYVRQGSRWQALDPAPDGQR
jgi:hypothetical protein